jgi:hypothetical protein
MKRYPSKNDTTRIVSDSSFPGVKYEVLDGHLIIWTFKDGTLAVQLEAVKQLSSEICEMAEVYGIV